MTELFYDCKQCVWKAENEPCYYGGSNTYTRETGFAADVYRGLLRLFRKLQCCLRIEEDRVMTPRDLADLFRIVYHFECVLTAEMKKEKYAVGARKAIVAAVEKKRRECVADLRKQYGLDELDDEVRDVGLVRLLGDQGGCRDGEGVCADGVLAEEDEGRGGQEGARVPL